MIWAALLGGIALFVLLSQQKSGAALSEIFGSGSGESGKSTGEYSMDDIFERYGLQYGVDPVLLKAVATVESGMNPNAENPRDPSVGLMQVLCKPDDTGRCTNHFNVDGWNTATWEKLHDPDFNVMIGAQILAWNIRIYGYPRGIAVYNSWQERFSPMAGPFGNQAYVDKVIAAYSKISLG